MENKEKYWAQHANMYSLETKGITHKILPTQIYTVEIDDYGKFYLVEYQKKFVFDYKVYGLESKFIDRTVKTARSLPTNLGVLLNGERGTGKTVTAKQICNKLNLPVIVIDREKEGLARYINTIPQDIIVFIDEYEKIFKEADTLLSIMDGSMNSEFKRVFILTTNDLSINLSMLQRPSRIRYLKTFNKLEVDVISEVVQDCLVDNSKVNEVISFISTLSMITIDIIKSICQEVNIHNDLPDDFEQFFNIKKNTNYYNVYCLDNKTGKRISAIPTIEKIKLDMEEDLLDGYLLYLHGQTIGTVLNRLSYNTVLVDIIDTRFNKYQKAILSEIGVDLTLLEKEEKINIEENQFEVLLQFEEIIDLNITYKWKAF